MTNLAYEDPLTGLPNRRQLYRTLEELEQNLEGSAASSGLSLVLVDVDHLRELNRARGHEAGDAFLQDLAKSLQRALGASDVPESAALIRYAGDEFVAILPGIRKSVATAIASTMERAAKQLVAARSDEELPSVSLGVSTLPQDAANVRDLLDACDRAVCAAKEQGGARTVDVATVEDDAGSSLAVTHGGFPCAELIGRDDQRMVLQGAVAALERGDSSIVLLTGDEGSGKSRLLQAATEDCRDRQVVYLRLQCQPYDPFQAYASVCSALDDLLARGELEVDQLTSGIDDDVRKLLATLLPSLRAEGEAPLPLAQFSSRTRNSMFHAVVRILRNLGRGRTLALFFDDAHWIDSGSLQVALQLVRSRGFATTVVLAFREEELLVPLEHPSGGEAGEGGASGGGDEANRPLTDFLAEPPDGIPPPVPLESPPLLAGDLSQMIRAVFPRIQIPEVIEARLIECSAGSPLYVEAALKALLGRGKIQLMSKRWVISDDLTIEEVPATLAEALVGELDAAGDEVREVLTNAAAIGQTFDVEMLSQVSGRSEEEVWGNLDLAAKQKMIRHKEGAPADQFEFAHRAFQETSVEATPEDRRPELYEMIADAYESRRAQQDELVTTQFLLQLAHYHGSAGNVTRASEYREAAASQSAMLYAPSEAEAYTRPRRERIPAADTPLSDSTRERMEDVYRSLNASAKNLQLYPKGSRMIQTSMAELVETLAVVFRDVDAFTLAATDEELLVNGIPAGAAARRGASHELWKVLRDHHVSSVTFAQGVSPSELQVLLDELVSIDKSRFDPQYWDDLFDEHGVTHIAVDQRVYVVAGSEAGTTSTLHPGPTSGPASSVGATDTRPRSEPGTPKAITPNPIASRLDQLLQADQPLKLSPELQEELPSMLDELLRSNRKLEVGEISQKLLQNLNSEDPETRKEAASFLRTAMQKTQAFSRVDLGQEVQESLLGHLTAERDADAYADLASVAADAARGFLLVDDYEQTRQTVHNLRRRDSASEPDPAIRAAARDALSNLLETDFYDLLLADLQQAEAPRKVDATRILAEFGELSIDPLIVTLRESDDLRTRRIAAEALVSIGVKAHERLGEEIARRGLEDRHVIALLESLDLFAEAGFDILEQVRLGVTSPVQRVRQTAYKLARRQELPGLAEIVLEALGHPLSVVVCDAVAVVGSMRLDAAATAVAKILTQTEVDEVRRECCIALGKLQAPEGVKALDAIVGKKKMLSSQGVHPIEVRSVAAWALSQIEGKEAERAYERAKKDPEIKNWLRYSERSAPGGKTDTRMLRARKRPPSS